MFTIGITGAGGLIGFHLRARLLALHKDVRVIPIPTPSLDDEERLAALVAGCDTVVHLAYLIVGEDRLILQRNQEIAERLVAAVDRSGRRVNLVFASSTHIDRDTAYGESKRRSEAFFSQWAARGGHTQTSLVLPNVFGEGGRPKYNSVVATFCDALTRGEKPEIIADTELSLLHAQGAAEVIWRSITEPQGGRVRVGGRPMRVIELADVLSSMAADYRGLVVPDLSDPLRRDLFNTYRSYLYPRFYPARLERRSDARGSLFEALKARQGGQAFFSTTNPGVTRGNHFHLHKLERFCVARGQAKIQIRKLFSAEILDFNVTGAEPHIVDIPTFHTHSIINTGDDELLTLFWADEIFDPSAPDTFAEPVVVGVQ